MIDGHPANFYPVPRGESGRVNRDAGVLNPHDFDGRAQAAVFENGSKRFPMAGIRWAGEGGAANPVSFVAFHHRLQSSTGQMHSGESLRGLFTSGESSSLSIGTIETELENSVGPE